MHDNSEVKYSTDILTDIYMNIWTKFYSIPVAQ